MFQDALEVTVSRRSKPKPFDPPSPPASWRPIADIVEADLAMKDLSALDNSRLLASMVAKLITEDHPHVVIAREITFIRLVSRAVTDYERARAHLLAFIAGKGTALITPVIRATDELESVFNGLH